MIEIKNLFPYEHKDGKKFDELEVGYAVAKLVRYYDDILLANQEL